MQELRAKPVGPATGNSVFAAGPTPFRLSSGTTMLRIGTAGLEREKMMIKRIVLMFVSLMTVSALTAQETAPELAKPQAHYKAAAEKIETQKKEAVAKAAKSYLKALAREEKKALASAAVDVVEAVAKEREAVLSGNIGPEFPEKIPAGMQIENARKNTLLYLERVNENCSKQRSKLDGDYLKYLSKLQTKHASNGELVKQIIAERAAVMKLITEAKAAGIEVAAKEEVKVVRGKNMLANGDFEQVVDGKLEGWVILDTFSNVKPVSEKDNSFIRFDVKTTAKDGSGRYCHMESEAIEIPANAIQVELKFKLRTNPPQAFNAQAPFGRVCFYRNAQDVNDSKKAICDYVVRGYGVERKWKKHNESESIPLGAKYAQVMLTNGRSSGLIDFDDIEVTFK